MERVADAIEERRDELARTLTLDQGKPLKGEAYGEVEELVEYWRMAAADVKRLEGLMPPSADAGKRVLVYRVPRDRKSTRLNSSHANISYAVFCLKKKNTN